MSALEQHQLWIGLGFSAVLVIFLIWAYARERPLAEHQRNILRLLSSLCAGFAGALFVGEGLLQMERSFETGTKVAIQGAGGFALFFVVWFWFGKREGLAEGYNFSVPEGHTFRDIVDAIAGDVSSVAAFERFEPSELEAPLRSAELQSSSPVEALERLRSLAGTQVRPYVVKRSAGRFLLRVQE